MLRDGDNLIFGAVQRALCDIGNGKKRKGDQHSQKAVSYTHLPGNALIHGRNIVYYINGICAVLQHNLAAGNENVAPVRFRFHLIWRLLNIEEFAWIDGCLLYTSRCV